METAPVNGRDSGLLLQYLAEWDVSIEKAAADLNGDNLIDGKDSGLLLQYLAEWDVPLADRTTVPVIDTPEYRNRVTEYSTSYGGTDALGRTLGLESDVGAPKEEKYVGLFYFLWMGAARNAALRQYENRRDLCGCAAEIRADGEASVPSISGESRCSDIMYRATNG